MYSMYILLHILYLHYKTVLSMIFFYTIIFFFSVLANVTKFQTNKNDIQEGDNITLSCTVTKGLPSPRIEILKNNRKIKELLGSNTSDTTLNYNFTRISHNSGGSYICEVRTNGYVSRKSYDFEVKCEYNYINLYTMDVDFISI